MNGLEALLLGILQGLTEYLPISSSGHLMIGKALFGIEPQGASFEIVVHAATVLSTITVFRKEIIKLLRGAFCLRYNEENRYLLMLVLSMLPILVVGFLFKSQVEALFGFGLALVGSTLLITAILLIVAQALPSKEATLEKKEVYNITYRDALIMGLAQAVAVFPGLSRSGATISTGLLLGKDRSAVAKFSFLMVLAPILGEASLDLLYGGFAPQASGISNLSLLIGFLAAYLSGLVACGWMVSLIKRAKLWGFALYCTFAGGGCLLYTFLH